jgi:hypothetical protein
MNMTTGAAPRPMIADSNARVIRHDGVRSMTSSLAMVDSKPNASILPVLSLT